MTDIGLAILAVGMGYIANKYHDLLAALFGILAALKVIL